MDLYDFSMLSLDELDIPEDVIINFSSLIPPRNNLRNRSIALTQDDIDFVRPILLDMSRILNRYR